MHTYSIQSLPILLRNPKILVIGGGKVALQKIQVLLSNNIDFSVITESICDELHQLCIPHVLKRFEKTDAEGYHIIIDATGNPEVNRLLREVKKERYLLVNTVDVPEECDFYFSALLHYNNLKIAISTDGASPTLAQEVRERIRKYLPRTLANLAEQKRNEREKGIINVEETKQQARRLFGKVYIIGCGIGNADLLTIKAMKILKEEVDVVLYDHLVSEDILELIPSTVKKIYVGKSKGKHSYEQHEINELLLRLASEGQIVGRLKNGDPFIYGRGSEEALFLLQHNITVEIIPGISSVTAAPLSAGIPPTLRDVSSSFSVVTGHCKDSTFDFSWIPLLRKKNHTVIVLMGLTRASDIRNAALREGIDPKLPVAVITNACRENQRILLGELQHLDSLVHSAESPAVLVFGDVVKYSVLLPHFRCENIEAEKEFYELQ